MMFWLLVWSAEIAQLLQRAGLDPCQEEAALVRSLGSGLWLLQYFLFRHGLPVFSVTFV